jgi:sulfate/thiosulfate transport system permease protein
VAEPTTRRRGTPVNYVFRVIVTVYLVLLVAWPVSLVAQNTFADGLTDLRAILTDPDTVHALRLSVVIALTAVVINTVFGVGISLLLVRYQFPGRRLLSALLDVPVSVSPIVVGLALVLVYGVVPVLEEVGEEQEQAAHSLGAGAVATFSRITLPAIRWGVVYGVVLSLARSLGEFGAVKVVSGNVLGQTRTATLVVEEKYLNFDKGGAYATAFLLALVAVACIIVVSVIRPKEQS